MGALARDFDWSATSLGSPQQWPLSLRTSLGIVFHSAFPMFLFWGEELICFYNDAFRPSLGIEGKHPALGKKGKEVWPEIWEFIGPLISGVMATGEPVYFEDQLVPFYRNGRMEDIYWTFSYSPVFGDSGHIEGVFVTCTETTGKIEVVKRAEASEQRVRSIVESAPFPIGVYTGKEMWIRVANQSILNAWGKGSDVIDKRFSEVMPELDNQEIFAQLDQVYTTGIPFHARNQLLELVINGKPQYFYYNYSFTPLYDAAGQVYGVMNTAADVTDLNLAKQKVEQSEANFRKMILQAPVAMCILLGPDHVIEVANELMIALWGKPEADVMGKPVFEGLPDAREQGLEQLLADVYHNGITFKASERPVVLLRNGSLDTVYQDFVYEPYRGVDGVILGVLVVTIDVTEQVIARHKIEEIVAERTKELAAANDSLQKSNAALEQFAYIASHDLQEPVRKVSTFAQMLESSLGKTDERSEGYLKKIRNSAARMLTLIKDVLAYSELSTVSQPLGKVSLQQIVADIIVDFEVLAEQKQATISFTNLPEINGISLQLSQLFGNLISNALKYNRPDVPPVITITAVMLPEQERSRFPSLQEHTRYYKIEVADNGIGFSNEYAAQIFHIFQRLHGNKQYEGTGIGLAICQKVVANHHGAIYASSELGKGSRFTVILPA
jgi:signal transduction histidine kinase